MSVLVTSAFAWLAAVLTVILVYTLGPPARRLMRVRQEIEQEAEEIRQAAARVRDEAVQSFQDLDRPIDEHIPNYQEARRRVLPEAADHGWGERELARWKKQAIAERGHQLRIRNLAGLAAWNLGLTATFAIGAWIYYERLQSQIRPQVTAPTWNVPQP